MPALLITLTVLEVAIFLGAVALYLLLIGRSLRLSAGYLGKVSFGVRAIESQCEPIGGSVGRINQQLTGIADALAGVATIAEARTR